MGQDPRSSLFLGHLSKLHWLPFNLPKQRSVTPRVLDMLIAASHLPLNHPQLLRGSQASHWAILAEALSRAGVTRASLSLGQAAFHP